MNLRMIGTYRPFRVSTVNVTSLELKSSIKVVSKACDNDFPDPEPVAVECAISFAA